MTDRDTDADWRQIGQTEPFWGVLTQDRYRRARMDRAAKQEFYASGAEDSAFVLSRIRPIVPAFRPRRALDFGCGVGRMTLAMAEHACQVTGVDVAPGMLAEARRSAEERRVRNAEFVEALPEGAGFDWINSCIVFQHILPRRGYAILAELLGRLVPGGVCSIQLCFLRDQSQAPVLAGYGRFWQFDGEVARAALDEDPHPAGTMRMFDYDLNRVLAVMLAQGVEPFGIAPTNHDGHHGAWLFGRH